MAILKFCIKRKNTFILKNGVRLSDFNIIVYPHGIHIVICHFLPKHFSAILAVILNFLVIHKNTFISETVHVMQFQRNFLPAWYTQSHLALFQESILLPFFAGRLNFCIVEKQIKQSKIVTSSKSIMFIGMLCFCCTNTISFFSCIAILYSYCLYIIKRPARDASLCMGELQAPPAPPAPPAPHFVFLITL